MVLQINPRPAQLADLATLRNQGPRELQKVIDAIKNHDRRPLKVSDLRAIIKGAGFGNDEAALALLRQLTSLYSLMRQRDLDPVDVFDGLTAGIRAAPDSASWSAEEVSNWQGMRDAIINALSQPRIWTVVKALDLAFDYGYLLQKSRIIVDVRPVFDEHAQGIDGAVVSFILGVNYDDLEGDHRIHFAIDETDIKQLRESCDRALHKARLAQSLLCDKSMIPSMIAGQDDSDGTG